ncbi:hypothetical protein [Oryza sativa Japonica Group]|uniref:Uncharacterized protein n=4 Tax=Oryza TaxID=4527 RepID=Q5VPP5_ORYSJ|nr:hypothetical protein [Oryza sativa Japonica Group]BAD68947.1 hypothetical protein [Oryza sativa Japonica Group]
MAIARDGIGGAATANPRTDPAAAAGRPLPRGIPLPSLPNPDPAEGRGVDGGAAGGERGSGGRPPSLAGSSSPPLPVLPSPDPAEGRGVSGGAAEGEHRCRWRMA